MTWPLPDKSSGDQIQIDDWNSICDRMVAIAGDEDYASVHGSVTGDTVLRHGRWLPRRNFATEIALNVWTEYGTYINITQLHSALWYIDIELTHRIGFDDYNPIHFVCEFDENSDIAKYLGNTTTDLLFHIPFTTGQIDLLVQNNSETYMLYYVVDNWHLSYHGFQMPRRL